MQPKIGIVICGLEGNHQFVSNPYIQSVRYSHGLPLLLPLVRSEDLLNQYVSLCDGFLFCGGGDITPLLFGESPLPGNGRTSISTDIFQLHLMRQILSSRKPVFAICRGMQLLNVACDETIEAIELKDYPFGVGVQWHPECMFRTSPEMRTLFKNFVEHCSVSGE